MDNRKLVLILEDILMEHGGEETVSILKNEYSNYSIDKLLEFSKSLLKLKTENHPLRHRIFIGDYLDSDEYTVVYESNEIDYKELLISLVVLLYMINIEQRPKLIIDLAQYLHKMDREVSDRFAKDLAEEVHWEYR